MYCMYLYYHKWWIKHKTWSIIYSICYIIYKKLYIKNKNIIYYIWYVISNVLKKQKCIVCGILSKI
jgi:hypothetical protein